MARIASIEAYVVEVPVKGVFRIAYSEARITRSLIVKVVLDNGVYGFGEASPSLHVTGETIESVKSFVELVADGLRGLKLPEELNVALKRIHFLDTFSSGRAALETALLDATARHLGVRLVDLLGGPLYVEIETDITVSLSTPEEMAKQAREYVDRGFRTLKLKLGGPASLDVERVKAVREAVSDSVRIRVDVNQAWSLREALWAIPKLEELGVELVEQPTPAWCLECLETLSKSSTVPIAADESAKTLRDITRLATRKAVDVVNVKLAKIGGPLQAVTAARVAASEGLEVMYGCMLETRLGITAAASAAYASPNLAYVDLDAPLLLQADPIRGGVEYHGALLRLSEKPGLGVDGVEGLYRL